MRFHFEHLGALDSGQLDLNDLTVICGKNNIGKTYLTYALYGFLKGWKSLLDVRIQTPEYNTLSETGTIEIDLNKFVKKSNDIISSAATNYREKLGDVLSAEESRFYRTVFECEASLPKDILSSPFKADFNSESGNSVISFEKLKDSSILTISSLSSTQRTRHFIPRSVINSTIKEIIWSSIFPNTFIVSSERTGTVTFRGELNLSKNRLIDIAHKIKADDPERDEIIYKSLLATGYAMPVSDNVEFINRLAQVEKRTGTFARLHEDVIVLLEEIVGGTYKAGKDGQIDFYTRRSKSRMRMGESSSAVRSLIILSYYLKYMCEPGDLLIIDEPELNLHPSNQRKLARLLVRLVNCGIKVFITTHSDYFIREFNTLIMLRNKDKRLKQVIEKYGYSRDEFLDPERVSVYTILQGELYKPSANIRRVKGVVLKRALIDNSTGIAEETFDETINEMNDIQDVLYSIISESRQ